MGCRIQLNVLLKKKRAATLAATIATTLFVFPVSGSERLENALESVNPPIPPIPEIQTQTQDKTITRWKGRGFSTEEQRVLEFLQERGITDRAALATILGNIKQESRFQTTICEGGANTGYHGCHRGGFGLIQWTTVGRYNGLGNFARNYGLNPNDLTTQLRWMVNEREWRQVEYVWKTPGKSIEGYMWAAKKWLGWGIHGARTTYSYQYYDMLQQETITVEETQKDK